LIASLQKSLGLTVFMVTHDLDTLNAIATRVAVLVNRTLKVGTIAEVRADGDPWIQEYFSGPRGRAAIR
jgi:phospholipid/cholesterol/gamma-HCH transport system ATP-binding protein